MSKAVCLLFLLQLALIWAESPIHPIHPCMTEFKEKFGKLHEGMKMFMKAKNECMKDVCGKGLEVAGFGECWTMEEEDKAAEGLAKMIESYKEIINKAAEMAVGDCPTMRPPPRRWTFDELFGRMGNHFHFGDHICMEAFFHKFLPKPAQMCLTKCIMDKIKDNVPLLTIEQVQDKLDWLADPKSALPKFMEEMDLKRAAMCIVNSCDIKILLGVVEQSGLKGMLIGKKAFQEAPEFNEILGQKCTCLRGLAEKNGVELSGLETLDCADPMGFLKQKMVCPRLVLDKFQIVKEVMTAAVPPPP